MNESRRSLLKALPFCTVGTLAAAHEGKKHEAEASVAEVPAGKDTRVVFAFRLTRPASFAAIAHLQSTTREILDAHGFSDAMAFILPEYLELDIHHIEGANHVRNRHG